MDKADKDRIKLALLRPERNAFFVYAPAKRGLFTSPTLEFLLTQGQREVRVQELKAKHGDKLVKGRIEKKEDDTFVFRCVRKPPPVFATDLRKMGQKIDALAGATIVEGDDDIAMKEKGATDGAAATKVLADDARQQGKADQHVDAIKDVKLKQRVQGAITALPEVAKKVAKYEDYVEYARQPDFVALTKDVFDRLSQRKASLLKLLEVAEQTYSDARDELDWWEPGDDEYDGARKDLDQAWEVRENIRRDLAVIDIAKPELEEMLGKVHALYKLAEPKTAKAVSLTDAAVALRGKAKDKSELTKLADAVQAAVQATNAAKPDVNALREAIGAFERRADDVTGIIGATRIKLPTDDGPGSGKPKVDVFTRLRETHEKLVASSLTEHVAKRVPVVRKVRQLSITGTDGKGYQDNLAALVLLSKIEDTKLDTLVDGVDDVDQAAAVIQQITAKGLLGSAVVTQHVKAVAEWYGEAAGKEGINDYTKRAADKGLPALAIDQLKTIALFSDDAARIAFGSVRSEDDPAQLGPVRITESAKVVVAGGGPVGLMAAIEARLKGSRVVLYEGRPDEYSRKNILALNELTAMRLARYGVADALGLKPGSAVGFNVPVYQLEEALLARAEGLGVSFIRGRGISEIDQDEETGEVLLTIHGQKEPEAATLVIITVGGGIASPNKHVNNVVMSDQLGLSIDQFGLVDYAGVGVFGKQDDVQPDQSRKTPGDRAAWVITLETPTQKYLLTQLTADEFAQVGNDEGKLKAWLKQRATVTARLGDLDLQAAGRFKIVVQRADHFVDQSGRAAVVVGDSAATPHPESGSGANTGAFEVSAVGELITDLVHVARKRSGKRAERQKALQEYDQTMEGIVTAQAEKGVRVMMSKRKSRLVLAANELVTLRGRVIPHVGARDPKITELLETFVDAGRAGKAVETFYGTVDLSQGKAAWAQAERVGRGLERAEKAMLDMYAALKDETQPIKIESHLRKELPKVKLEEV